MGATKQLKRIIEIEHNIVKNANWPEANQLAIRWLNVFCFKSKEIAIPQKADVSVLKHIQNLFKDENLTDQFV